MARPSYTEPSDFDRALLLELQALKDSGWGRFSHIGASRSLSESFREEALSELDRMQVPLFSLEGGHLGQAQLKRLATELYTKDAVELIQQYIIGLIAPWDHLTRDYVLNLARFQLAQVYWSSALLGHALRDAEQPAPRAVYRSWLP
ncbi:unnamed protein product [Effrenium voratum]|nr:unnamed protein product [Effrenium voratum]